MSVCCKEKAPSPAGQRGARSLANRYCKRSACTFSNNSHEDTQDQWRRKAGEAHHSQTEAYVTVHTVCGPRSVTTTAAAQAITQAETFVKKKKQ